MPKPKREKWARVNVEEALCRGTGLVGQDGGEGETAMVVDGDVEVLVACAPGFARTVSVDAMAWLDDAGQTFDIEVDQVPRSFVLVADHWRRWIEGTQPVHAGSAQDAAYGGAAQVQHTGDPPAVVAQTAKCKDLFYDRG